MESNQSDYKDEACCFNEELQRIEGKSLEELLQRSLVAITFSIPNKRIGAGSGVLISKDTILTAAHNIFNKKSKKEYTDFKFYIGANGTAGKHYQIDAWKYPLEFKTCAQQDRTEFDYAIMKLKRPIVFDSYLPLSLFCQKCLPEQKQKMLKVYGFPLYSNNYELNYQTNQRKIYQYGLAKAGRILLTDKLKSKVDYQISTHQGQSGSPLVVDDSIIAVHVGGIEECKQRSIDGCNFGRIINADLIKNLKQWTKQVNASPFAIKRKKVCIHVQQILSQLSRPQIQLDLSHRFLLSLDLTQYFNLLMLDLSANKLEAIDLSYCPQLSKVKLKYNQLQCICIKENANISWLDLSYNQLSMIDISFNINLVSIYLVSNHLSAIDTRANVNLRQLHLDNNQLPVIDVRTNSNLTSLYLPNYLLHSHIDLIFYCPNKILNNSNQPAKQLFFTQIYVSLDLCKYLNPEYNVSSKVKIS